MQPERHFRLELHVDEGVVLQQGFFVGSNITFTCKTCSKGRSTKLTIVLDGSGKIFGPTLPTFAELSAPG